MEPSIQVEDLHLMFSAVPAPGMFPTAGHPAITLVRLDRIATTTGTALILASGAGISGQFAPSSLVMSRAEGGSVGCLGASFDAA